MTSPLLLVLLALVGAQSKPPTVTLPNNLDRLDPAVRELVELQASAVRPDDAASQGELGLVYEANSLWDEARASFEEAVRLDSAAREWRFHLALARRESGDLSGALELLLGLARESISFPALEQRLGDALLEVGDLGGARDAFERLTELLPDEPDGYVGLGEVLLRAGDAEGALPVLSQAVAVAPGYRMAHYLLGTAYARLGRQAEAERELKRGVGGDIRYLASPLQSRIDSYAVSLGARLARARGLLATGRPSEAVALLDAARQHHPENTTLLNNLAIAQMRQGALEDAAGMLEEARRLDPDKFSTYLNLASLALRAGRLDEALVHADKAVARAPELAAPRFTRAQVLARSRRYEEALASLESCLELDSGNAQAMAFSGDVALALERFDSARRHFENALEIAPSLLPAWIGLARSSLALGDLAAAEAALDEARRRAGGHPEVDRLERELRRSQ